MIAVDPGEQGAVARWTADGLAWVLPLDGGFLPAQALAERGYQVIVVEARDRLGGRIHTPTIGSQPVDLGAS